MKVEIAFGSRRATCAPLAYKFRRLKPGERWCGVILSPMPTVVVYHWMASGKPAVHTMPSCVCQVQALPSRERGYVATSQDFILAKGEVKSRLEVLELPESLRGQIELLAGDRRYVRGLKLELLRAPGKQNGRVDVLRHRWLDAGEVLPDLDVRTFVERLWEGFVLAPVEQAPPAAAGPGSVDDGGEIPFGRTEEGDVLPLPPRGKGGVA